MGAEQSTNRSAGGSAEESTRKTCYYELLGVERTATDEEIKKSYRRRALELHPDRNLHDTENATRKFTEIQAAYEILSDPQERAWYDSHRDAILRGDNGGGDDDDDGEGNPRFYNNVRLTPTEELVQLMGRFNRSVPFDDTPNGFFGIVEATFAQLALEEEAACSWDGGDLPVQYPPFGSSNDDYESTVRPFYRAWTGFATQKSFSWKDKYRISDGPDRYTRRVMEKENKKARDKGIREFNDTVRDLLAFVRKRDPRYVPNTQTGAERQQTLRNSAAAQAARQRAANQEKLGAYVEPEWARVHKDEAADRYQGGFSESEQESEIEEIECVVCDKSFKSEKQFEAHERSKKHIKAVQQLKRQMRKENKDFDLVQPEPEAEPEEEEEAVPEEAEEESSEESAQKSQTKPVKDDDSSHEPLHEKTRADHANGDKNGKNDDENENKNEEDDDEDDDIDAAEKARMAATIQQEQRLAEGMDGLSVAPKIGKAKAKREKKAARQAAAAEGSSGLNACKICNETFSSNTKLHKHLRVAHPAPSGGKAKGKRSR